MLNIFQFHNGTIKTNYGDEKAPFTAEFQFHKGTIKTYLDIF